MEYQTPTKQIRKFCLGCCCGRSDLVKVCPALDCALWYMRFGINPMHGLSNKFESNIYLNKDNFKGRENLSSIEFKKWIKKNGETKEQ